MAMEPEDLEAVHQVVRDELRAAGLRRPMPNGLGVWRWSAEQDAWIAVTSPDSPARPQTAASA